MANEKRLLEIFSRYEPGEAARRLLDSAQNTRLRASREERMIEIHADFAQPVEKALLYSIEAGIAEAYQLRSVRLLPHYPADTLTDDYLPQILTETERVGIVARGFFSRYAHTLTDNELTVSIPFSAGGVRLLYDARTPEVIAGIIRSEFGREMTVTINQNQNIAPTDHRETRFAALDRSIAEAEVAYHNHKAAPPPEPEEEKPTLNLKKVQTLLKFKQPLSKYH